MLQLRDRERWRPAGTVINAGKEEFAKAIQLIKEGKPIKYQGVIGPIAFDQYGDIPARSACGASRTARSPPSARCRRMT